MTNEVRIVPIVKPQNVSHRLGLYGPISSLMARDSKSVGSAVRRARERHQWTRENLGERVGLSVEAIKKIESGERVEKWLQVANFAEALQTSPNDLLGFPVASAESLGMALRPILSQFGYNPETADSIASILLEAVEAAQSLPDDGPEELRFRLAAQLAASRFRGQKIS